MTTHLAQVLRILLPASLLAGVIPCRGQTYVAVPPPAVAAPESSWAAPPPGNARAADVSRWIRPADECFAFTRDLLGGAWLEGNVQPIELVRLVPSAAAGWRSLSPGPAPSAISEEFFSSPDPVGSIGAAAGRPRLSPGFREHQAGPVPLFPLGPRAMPGMTERTPLTAGFP